ncbi:hypothetical protein CU098_003571 [Rhizopus stolonifer]|uniref:Uncharacterized protein n=1 Tax=Rhizopus stolonifer TaxID=4846 RepID=A0A367IJV3_RHIST|nr:hypothetical protein CU098_003571 [Rhizopus stolonifer]
MHQIDSNNSNKPVLPSPPSSPTENNNNRKRALSLSFIQNPNTESLKKSKALSPNQCDPNHNRSLLSWACIAQCENDVKELMKSVHLDINLKSGPNQTTALHEAAFIGFDKGVQLLVQHSEIDLNAVDLLGQTALHYATQRNKTESLKILLTSGARVDICCKNGRLPIHTAALFGFESCVSLLLSFTDRANNPDGLDMLWSQENLTHQSVVECAIVSGRVGSLNRLLDQDSDSCYREKKELVALAVHWNRIECLVLLLSRGCLADEFCLRSAVQQRKIDLVRILASAGTSPCLKNGQNPAFLYAANHGFLEMIPIILTLSTSKDCIQQALCLASSIGLHKKLCEIISHTFKELLIKKKSSS